jgi:hypothetical protein
MRIKISVPSDGKRWKVSFGNTPSYRKTATTIYKLVERKLNSGVGMKEKTSIMVIYDHDTSNESLVSLDASYLLNILACFLEDYLEKDFLDQKYKQYSQK